jgi:hypothetical protein
VLTLQVSADEVIEPFAVQNKLADDSAPGQKRRIIDITSPLRWCGAANVAIRSSN